MSDETNPTVDSINTTNESSFVPTSLKRYFHSILTTLLMALIGYGLTGQWNFEESYGEQRDNRDQDMVRLLRANDEMIKTIHRMDKELAVLKVMVTGDFPLSPAVTSIPEPAPAPNALPPSVEKIKIGKDEINAYQMTRGK